MARINATASERSFAQLRTWDYREQEKITVNSAILPGSADRRGINILGLTLNARIEIDLGLAEVHIEYGSIRIDISSSTHMVTVVSGQYQIMLKTLRSPFNVSVTSDLMTLSADNASVLISPTQTNLTARTLQALMQIQPADASVSVGGSALEATKRVLIETRQNSITEIRPQTDQILVESAASRMLIETQYNQVGVESNLTRIDLQHGNPHVLIETGNTSIEIRKVNGSVSPLPTQRTLPLTNPLTLFPGSATVSATISATSTFTSTTGNIGSSSNIGALTATASNTNTASGTATATSISSGITASATITAATVATIGTSRNTNIATATTTTAIGATISTAIGASSTISIATTTITAATTTTAISSTTDRSVITTTRFEGDFVTLISRLSSIAVPPMNMTITAVQNSTAPTIPGISGNPTTIGPINSQSTTSNGVQNQTNELPVPTIFRITQFNVSIAPQVFSDNGSAMFNFTTRAAAAIPTLLRELLGTLTAQNATVLTADTVPSFLVDLFAILQNQTISLGISLNESLSDEQMSAVLPLIEQFYKFLTFPTSSANLTATVPSISVKSNETTPAPLLTEFLIPLIQAIGTPEAGFSPTANTGVTNASQFLTQFNQVTQEIGKTTIEPNPPNPNLGESTSSPSSANVPATSPSNGGIQTTPINNGTNISSNATQGNSPEIFPLRNNSTGPIQNVSNLLQNNSNTEVSPVALNFIEQIFGPVENANLPGRNESVTLIPELQNTAEISRLLRKPLDDSSLLNVELSVKPQENTSSPTFFDQITRGLKNAYLEGRMKQLGSSRSKRLALYDANNDTESVTVKVIKH